MYRQDFLDYISQFEVGDHIKVNWNRKKQGMGKECYLSEGKIVQITDSAIYYRGKPGFTAGISLGDIAMGVEVKQVS